MARAYARTLYGYNLSGPPDQVTAPVPDIASGPPQLSDDRRTYTFTLRPGVRYAPPVDREVTAQDFITAIQRLYDKTTSSDGRSTPTLSPAPDGSVLTRPAASQGWPPPTPTPSPSPWPNRPKTSCRSSPSRSSPRCQESTRPTTPSGPTTTGMWSAPAPTPWTSTTPDGWSCWSATPTGIPPPIPCGRPGWTGSGSGSAAVSARASRRSSGRRPTCRWTATCPRRRSPRSRPTRSDPSGCRSTPRNAAVPHAWDPPGGRRDR